MGPQAGLRAALGPEGAAVAPEGAPEPRRLGLEADARCAGQGCEGEAAAVPPAAPRRAAAGGRVEYPHAGITEWYVEGPRGLEQGFTLPAAPACRRRGGGPVVIDLAGGLDASVLPGGRTRPSSATARAAR